VLLAKMNKEPRFEVKAKQDLEFKKRQPRKEVK
jgi:hypothetical protein